MRAHPNFSHFFAVLTEHPECLAPWEGRVLRQAPPRWLSAPYRFTGAGAVLAGARWSVRGLMPAVYASTDPDTLNAEVYYRGREYGWLPEDFHPRLTVGMRWEMQRTLDLTQPATLQRLRLNPKELIHCDWLAEQTAGREALTQALGRAAFEHLAEGLVVPSARSVDGINVVYFPCHRLPGTRIEVLSANLLPPDLHGLDA